MVGACMLSTILAGARSVLAYLVILLYIVIAAPLGIVIALVFRWKQGLYTLGHWGAWLALNLVGIRYRVIGPEYLNTESVVFCSNHESNVDPPVLFNALHRRLHVFYKAELHKFPLMGTVFDIGGFIPVDRANREKARVSIERGAASIRSGNSFLIFPEGTRSRTGDLLPFKKGGFVMALEAQAPIVPVAISGGRSSMRKGSPIVRPAVVVVRTGIPIPTAGLTYADRNQLIRQVRAEIEALLAESKSSVVHNGE